MALSTAQKAALKTDIAANTNTIPAGQPWSGAFVGMQVKDVPNNGDGHAAIAGWYNLTATPDYFVWRDLPMEVVLGLITFANMTPLDTVPTTPSLTVDVYRARALACQGKQFNLQNLTLGRTVAPMKRINYRAAMQDCLTNLPAGAAGALITANWIGVRDAAKFLARNIEKLFANGNGAQATPSDLVFEGAITGNEVEEVRNQP